MTQHDRRQKLQTGGPGKLALILSVVALGCALIPEMQRKELSGPEKVFRDVQDSVGKLQRHAVEDSKFKLDFQGPGKWHTFAMLASIAGFVLGAVSIAEERLCGIAAALIGLAVGGWVYLGG